MFQTLPINYKHITLQCFFQIKNTYSKLMDLLNKIMNGDTTSQLSDMLEKFAEKYDKVSYIFISDQYFKNYKQIHDLPTIINLKNTFFCNL